MKRFFKAVSLLSWCLISANAFAEIQNNDLIISVNDVVQKTFTLDEIKKIKAVNVEFYDYRLRKSENFKGTLLLPLLSTIVPEQLRQTIEVELASINGYKTYLPIDSFSKVDAVLTYEKINGPFEQFSMREKATVNLGPYYLLWDFKTLGKEDKYLYSSVYQINKINLVTNVIDFGVRKVKNNEKLTLGYRTYKKYCLSCHAIGTWGGDLGVDLVKKKTLEIKGAPFIKKYIIDPQSLNAQTTMPALPKYKNSDEMAEGVIDFLKYVTDPEAYVKNINK